MLHVVPGETGGIEVYARELIRALGDARPDIDWLAFVPAEFEAPLRGARAIRTTVRGRSRVRRVLGEQVLVPRLVGRHRVDLLHSVASSAPVRAAAVQVVTIHDVNYAVAPEGHTKGMSYGQRIVVPAAARSADRIIAVSEYSRAAAIEKLGVAPDRIDAVPNGGGRHRERATPEPELRARLGLGEAPLILSLSARRPHKNLPRLLAAVARLRARPAPTLVLPGYRTVFDDELDQQARMLGIGERVRLLGWVDDADLEGLYAAARVFAFPSLAEGFGLPVLEAMTRGVPVACSDTSSLPEVGGDAVRYFDPLDVDSIAAALDYLMINPSAAERLAAAGRTRAARFSWERAARGTLATYERALFVR